MIWIDESGKEKKYEGTFHNDKPHGFGTLTYIKGTQNYKYSGEFLNGKKHGFGRFEYGTNRTYEGSWINGK